MATGKDWLQKQRKGDLSDIAEHFGLKHYEKYKKSELEVAVEEYLRSNASALSDDPRVAPFYQGVDPASPVKHKGGVVVGPKDEKEKKPRQRRQTIKAREEIDAPSEFEDPSTALTRTPARALTITRSIPLPPSPSVLADRIDAQTSSLRKSVSSYYDSSFFPGTLTSLRAKLSTVTGIELSVLLIEAWGLRAEVMPLRYLTTIPEQPSLGLSAIPVKVPDLFALLTSAFWGPVGLWALTSIFLPLLGAWFFNLQGEAASYDAVSFNTVKAIAAWAVYVRGYVNSEFGGVVENAVPGGAMGLLIGAGVGGVAGLYEAVLRR